MENKYRGICGGCGVSVGAYDGVYDGSDVLCQNWDYPVTDSGERDEIMLASFVGFFRGRGVSVGCGALWGSFVASFDRVEADSAAFEAARVEAARVELLRVELVAGLVELTALSRVRSLGSVVSKLFGVDTVANNLTYTQVCELRDELRARIYRREAREAREATIAELGYLPCSKCGGSGAYWKLAANGKYFDDKCFPCGGSGRKL